MIAGIFHQGSGIGNQLHRYVATRVLALDKGYNFGMVHPENFKASFIEIDMGTSKVISKEDVERGYADGVGWLKSGREFFEKKVVENDTDIRDYDPTIKDVEDGTVIDGEFQDERYFVHRLDEIREWLKVEPMEMPDDLCVINFRGGEYVGLSFLFLEKKYWDDAIAHMRNIDPEMKFEVHTDDYRTAKRFFPDFTVIADAPTNWRAIRYAKYLILSNSSFAILPAYLNQDVNKIIAPKYWARHNVSNGYWALTQNIHTPFTYMDREGKLFTAKQCREEHSPIPYSGEVSKMALGGQ